MIENPDVWSMMLKSGGMLCVVIGVLLSVLYLIRRFSAGARMGGAGGQTIKILSSTHLGPREKLILVDVMEKRVLLGVTPGRIDLITELDRGEALEPESAPVVTRSFSSLMEKALKGIGRK